MRTLVALFLLAFSISAGAQAWRDGPPLTGGGQVGTTTPATCKVGQLFFKSNATAGQNLYMCASANTWTQQLNSGASGNITIGTSTITSGTNTRVLYDNSGVIGEYSITGTGNVVMSASPAMTGTPTVGSSGSAGAISFGNATSGTITLQPVTGALGTVTLSMPAATDTLVGKATTDTLTNKTLTTPTISSPTITGTSVTFTSGTSRTIANAAEIIVCTSTCTITVPASATAGMQFCVQNDDNVSTVITLAAVSGVQYEATARTSYGTANHTMTSGGAVKDQICMVAISTTKWNVFSSVGTWTNN